MLFSIVNKFGLPGGLYQNSKLPWSREDLSCPDVGPLSSTATLRAVSLRSGTAVERQATFQKVPVIVHVQDGRPLTSAALCSRLKCSCVELQRTSQSGFAQYCYLSHSFEMSLKVCEFPRQTLKSPSDLRTYSLENLPPNQMCKND